MPRLCRVIWAQVHQTADLKQVKEGIKTADSIRTFEDERFSFPESTYLLYLSAVGKFNLNELGEAKKRAIQVLSIERDHTRAAILMHLIGQRSRRHRLRWLPWNKVFPQNNGLHSECLNCDLLMTCFTCSCGGKPALVVETRCALDEVLQFMQA